ncbi:uncharacterized protein EI97DRAFT_33609 [Westerdykella ornata]|uniref:C2H2-type domain-containing protein n=1 Tax=Westerdykella ornata TaxID=318751 RepID=A0A6A6JZB5_WESOR|nr:uncharacterized protein EI97DRAFT_33609 [Westerdykella ornata]KAF2281574.1 hypothetical protein EI97DRAFT_33609 [Westerdykella ornata]
METRQPEYSQSGSNLPYPSFPEPPSEGSSPDQPSAAQYQQAADPRSSSTYSTSATPTSEYTLNPPSARSSGNFPDYIQRSYQAPGVQGTSAAMAQQQSPSMPLQNGQNNDHAPNQEPQSNADVPIDPTIAAGASPTTYPPHGQQYAPYGHGDMQHHYQGQPNTQMYTQPRQEWGAPAYPSHMYHPHSSSAGPPAPSMVSPVSQRPPTGGHPLSTVYSFVPIPGAQQHKRPRRRYEEIERMYKCGWNGCEKAYGTLNHLNAHVTMQSHGAKRTPEEFKEIRKEWKAKKKEEEAARKAEEEARMRASETRTHDGAAPVAQYAEVRQPLPMASGAQLPPLGYQAASSASTTASYGNQSPGLNESMAHYAQSPYGQNQAPMYQQQNH